MSQNAIVTIYLHNEDGSLDSIHHPSCDFMFSIKNRELIMTRSDVRMAKVPFSNSLTQMELEASQITWQIDTDEIKIGNNKSEVDMYSANHFDERLFEKYYNINTINPIIKFYVYSQKLQQTQEDGQVNDYEEDFADDDYYCQMYPEECTESEEIEEEPLDTNFLISIGAWPPEEDEEIEEEVIEDFIEYGPRLIDASELTALLHKRLEKLHILTETEIEKARKNPKFKIVTDMQSYREFERYYPKIYKFAAIDVLDVLNLVPEEEIDVLSTLPLYMEMVKDGFIFYDKKTNAITLRDKIFHYAESVNKRT